MRAKMSVLGLIMSFSPYLRSEMVWFPLHFCLKFLSKWTSRPWLGPTCTFYEKPLNRKQRKQCCLVVWLHYLNYGGCCIPLSDSWRVLYFNVCLMEGDVLHFLTFGGWCSPLSHLWRVFYSTVWLMEFDVLHCLIYGGCCTPLSHLWSMLYSTVWLMEDVVLHCLTLWGFCTTLSDSWRVL